MTISELKSELPARFSGYYRIRKPFKCLATNGSPYLACLLEDMSGSMKAFAWPGQYRGQSTFADLDRVFVTGRTCSLQHGTVIHVEEAEIVEPSSDVPTSLIPRSLCPLPHLLNRLDSAVTALDIEPLRTFAKSILAEDSIALRFISLPASRKHHHSHPGGLLEHSLSCAEIVGRMSEFPRPVLELGIVGALFHDIGKIHSYHENGNRLESAHVLDHDDLTLEVLAGPLKELDNQCRDAGTALRYIWSWRRNRQNRRTPLITIAEAVLLADHISAGINAEILAFGNRQHWQQSAKLNERTRFWRPNLSRETASAETLRVNN
jgi:3'-5' exoribonuclease